MHRCFRLAFALLVIGTVALGALAVRLTQGPLPMPWMASVLENAANTPDQATRVSIGGVALAWGGEGMDRPIELRLSAIALTDFGGNAVAALPDASVSLSIPALLIGRIAARAVVLHGLDLRLMRSTDGSLALDLGTQGERLDAGAGTPEGGARRAAAGSLAYLFGLLTGPDDGVFGQQQLRRVVITDSRLAISDAQLKADWSLPDLNLDLRRTARGLVASGGATLTMGDESVRLGVAAQWQPGSAGTAVSIRLGSMRPATLAAASPLLAPLAMVDAVLSADARLQLDPDFRHGTVALALQMGPGRIVPPGTSGIPIRSATLTLAATPDRVELTDARVVLDAVRDSPAPTIAGRGVLQLGVEPALALNASLARFDLADLAHVWPEGLGRNERAWLVPNLTAGVVSDLVLSLEATLPADLSDLMPRRMEVAGRVDGATVHYLRPMPPVEDARGRFRIDLDAVDVTAEGGRIGRGIQGRGTVRLSDLSGRPQSADIAIDVTAQVPPVLALLQHPRLKLFEARPLPAPVREATGNTTAKLSIRFPLLDALPVEEVRVGVEGEISDARFPKILAGQDVTDGKLALSVTTDGMRMAGPVRIAGSPVTVTYEQDFRPGAPSQVIERLRAEGRAEESLLVALGLSTEGRMSGAPATTVALATRRNGQAEAAIRADLREARISLPEAGFEKPAGQPGSAEATLRMARERITALEAVRIEMPGLSARGRVGFAEGRPERITVANLALGRTRASGDIVLGRDGSIGVTARGAELDASPLFAPSAETPPPSPDRPPPGPPLRLDLGFERVWLANQRSVEGVALRFERRAGRIEQLSLSGRTGPDQPFEAMITRRADHRSLTMRAADAGAFLAGTDVISSMSGGRLSVEGRFNDATDALSGSAEIADFRVRDAPAIGRLLQGMTLYGLLDLARGPGLNFTQLTAPFSWADGVLTLADARAFSPSLGVTMKGRIDTRARRLDLEGTVVPAYFFNSLLGNIPLIGRLFSPERGGGVFAATYSVRGPMADPQVAVNPLAALTPGFLRGLFGIFDSAPAPPAAAGPGPPATPGQSPAPPPGPSAADVPPPQAPPPPGGPGSGGAPPG